MAEPVQFNVVTDSGGKLLPELNASVSVVARDEVGLATWPFESLPFTHTHFQNGFYRALSGNAADEPGPGEWLLVVALSGRSPVVQRLTLAEKGGVLVASAGWGVPASAQLAHTALTVSIVNYEQLAGAAPPGPAKQSRVIVRLLERMELVALACIDKTANGEGGTRFEEFAKGRANLLFADRLLNDGVVFTLLIAKQRLKQIWIKSRSPKPREWVLVGEHLKAPITAGEKRPVVGKDVGILDFYQHLHDAGRGAPGTVIEAGVFGHAYVIGPVVWNTFDLAASFTARDPNDFDGRNKDWVPAGAVATSFPLLSAALHPQRGAFRAWGCNHMRNVLKELEAGLWALEHNVPRDQLFLAQLFTGRENMTLDHLKRNLAQFAVSQKIRFVFQDGDASGVVAYCGAAAQALRVPCFGAPPGMGSFYGMRDGNLIMHIATDHTENAGPMRYYEREFGPFFVRDDLNYVDYAALRMAPLPDPGWATARFIDYHDEDRKLQILRLPSGLEIYRAQHRAYVGATPMTMNGLTGHLYVAPLAKPEHVEDCDADRVLILVPAPDQDTGVFVGQDGKSILLRRAAGAPSFTTNTDAVEVFRMRFAGGVTWDFSEHPPTTLTNGVLETVVPRWYW